MTVDALHAEIRHRAQDDLAARDQQLAYAQQQIADLRAQLGKPLMQAAVPREKAR